MGGRGWSRHVVDGFLCAVILVTGASGFIGRALCSGLLDSGHVVREQFRSTVPKYSRNVDGVVTGSLSGATDWRFALDGCSAVIHLAAHAHEHCEHDPGPCSEVNTTATLTLAEQAAAAGVRRFVFASTVKVNGGDRARAYLESDVPAPQDAYALSKWEAEQGLRAIAARTGMEVVILRFPLVYGPGVKGNFLRLMRAIDCGMPLPFGCVDNRRSLIYLGNLVSALQACLAEAAANKTFLVADGEDVSTPALIRRMAAAMGKPERLLPVPQWVLRAVGSLAGRQQVKRLLGSLYVDDGLIRRELAWVPPCSMQEGLMATAAWYRGSTFLASGPPR
jgi:nucleoside-diphosphate-sugar epimerase